MFAPHVPSHSDFFHTSLIPNSCYKILIRPNDRFGLIHFARVRIWRLHIVGAVGEVGGLEGFVFFALFFLAEF